MSELSILLHLRSTEVCLYSENVPLTDHCNITLHLHLADAFIQSDSQCIQVIHLLSVCVFPGN